jgi:hypothetical protein
MYPPASPIRQGLANSPYRMGDDRLMSNVLSFEVKFTGTSSAIAWPAPFPGNSDYPYDNLPYDGKFDTHSQRVAWQSDVATAANQTGRIKQIRITGVMIRIRALDVRTKTPRQTTVIVDL